VNAPVAYNPASVIPAFSALTVPVPRKEIMLPGSVSVERGFEISGRIGEHWGIGGYVEWVSGWPEDSLYPAIKAT